jgi:UDP-glucose 4-epimerase
MAVLKGNDQPRVLVTGNRGFIGKNLFHKLRNNISLVPLDQGDKTKSDILKINYLNSIEDIDAIVHLASKTSIFESNIDPYQTYLTNVMGTLNVLDFARQKNIRKIINFSTYVYGKPEYFPVDEKHSISPHSPYTKSKLLAENLCEYYAKDYGLDIVTLRPFYIYGPSSNKNTFIPSIIKQINQEGKVILSNKNTKRDFLYIDDLIDLIYRIILKFPSGYNIFNVGYGESHSLEEVVAIIEEFLKIDINIQYNDSIRPNDILDMVADISLLRKSFSWNPAVDIKAGVHLTLSDLVKKTAK